MPDAALSANDDKAWVAIDTPLAADELLFLCRDPERLFRINPFWIFKTVEYSTNEMLRLCIDNQANGQSWETEARIIGLPDGCRVEFGQGLKKSTTLRVLTTGSGVARLEITDDYSGSPPEVVQEHLKEVDNSLLPWGQALYRYLRSYKRWRWFPLWRWYERRLWRPATPSARRIMGMLVWATVAELVIFMALVALYLSVEPSL